ncbi:MAG: hypothetical protein ACT4OZ_10290 [Gemmatimonadota bacterium]
MMTRSVVVVAALLNLLACFPVVPTPTAIEPGARLGFTSTMHLTTRQFAGDSIEELKPAPVLGAYLAGGREATDWEPGLRGAVYVNWTFNVGLDAYLEVPKVWVGGADAGAGVQAQSGALPSWGGYLSAGHGLPGGRYLWVTQGATALRSPHDHVERWVTGTMVGLQFPLRYRQSGSVFVGLVFGPQDTRCSGWGPCSMATHAYVGASISREIRLGGGGAPQR